MHCRRSFAQLILLSLIFIYGSLAQTVNIPCNVREAAFGYICVCNATYCDTIERPAELPRGSYLHYSTSKDSPGFTVSEGKFFNITRTFLGSSKDVFIRVDSSVEYQQFDGFGASLTAAAGMLINSLPPGAQQKFIETYFGEKGVEYNMMRVPIAASDFSLRYYTYDDVPGDVDLKYFNLTEEDFQLKIPILKMANNTSKRGVKLVGSTWTAPDWMKTNNDYKLGYIKTKYHNAWANYYLKFLQAYKQNGIEFWGLTLGNEANIGLLFGPWFPIQNTLFPPLVARYWTKKYLGPLLKSSGFENVKILAMDDERPFMEWYMDRMLADKETAQYIDGVAVHWYLDYNINLYNLQSFHDKHPDKFILYTEASISAFNSQGGGAVALGDWDRATQYIESILTNLNNWVVGYIDWNIALNEQGGPTGAANLTLDASVIINETSGEFYKQPMFYAIGHFSKFIPPGAKKINVTINQPFKDSNFEFDDGKHRTWVEVPAPEGPYINIEDSFSSTEVPFPTRKPNPPITNITALASSNPDGSFTVIVYNPKSEPVNITIIDPKVGVFNQKVEPKSLNTFIYW